MANTLGKVSDFLIKIIMMFTTLVTLVYFSNKYVGSSLIFSLLAFIFVLSIITKGLVDIFSRESK